MRTSSAFSAKQFQDFGSLGLAISDDSLINQRFPIKTSFFTNKAAWELERIILETIQQLTALAEGRSELEIPEVFNLRPLSSQRVNVQIRKIEPAPFSFVDEDISVENED